MKISSSRLFDTQKVIDAFTAAKIQGIDDFIQNLSDLSDQTVKILRNRVSLSDNIDCSEREFEVSHNVSLTVGNLDSKRKVRHIVSTRCSSFDNPVSALAWRYNSKGDIDLKVQLLGAPTAKATIAVIMYY